MPGRMPMPSKSAVQASRLTKSASIKDAIAASMEKAAKATGASVGAIEEALEEEAVDDFEDGVETPNEAMRRKMKRAGARSDGGPSISLGLGGFASAPANDDNGTNKLASAVQAVSCANQLSTRRRASAADTMKKAKERRGLGLESRRGKLSTVNESDADLEA